MFLRPIAVFLCVLLLVSCAGSEAGTADRVVSVGSHTLHAVVAGEGAPAVVFDGGIATPSGEYGELQKRIASITTVVTYDRAGYGPSEAGPLPRESRTEAGELRSLLSRLGIPAPYVLVGHSLGCLNVEVYADLHPGEVAGMVLLDPPPLSFILRQEYAQLESLAARMTDEWQGIADRGLHSESEQERTRAAFFQMLASEHREMFGASARQAASIGSFGDTPLVVIASGVPNPMFGDGAEAYQQYWAAQSKALATKSSRGQFVLAQASTHRLHADAADLVADSILSMVESVREGAR